MCCRFHYYFCASVLFAEALLCAGSCCVSVTLNGILPSCVPTLIPTRLTEYTVRSQAKWLYFCSVRQVSLMPHWQSFGTKHRTQDTGQRHKQACGPPPLPVPPASPHLPLHLQNTSLQTSSAIFLPSLSQLPAQFCIILYVHCMLGHYVMPNMLTHHTFWRRCTVFMSRFVCVRVCVLVAMSLWIMSSSHIHSVSHCLCDLFLSHFAMPMASEPLGCR